MAIEHLKSQEIRALNNRPQLELTLTNPALAIPQPEQNTIIRLYELQLADMVAEINSALENCGVGLNIEFPFVKQALAATCVQNIDQATQIINYTYS